MEEKRHCLIFDMTKAGIFEYVMHILMAHHVGFNAEYNRDHKCIISFSCKEHVWRILYINIHARFTRHQLKDFEEAL